MPACARRSIGTSSIELPTARQSRPPTTPYASSAAALPSHHVSGMLGAGSPVARPAGSNSSRTPSTCSQRPNLCAHNSLRQVESSVGETRGTSPSGMPSSCAPRSTASAGEAVTMSTRQPPDRSRLTRSLISGRRVAPSPVAPSPRPHASSPASTRSSALSPRKSASDSSSHLRRSSPWLRPYSTSTRSHASRSTRPRRTSSAPSAPNASPDQRVPSASKAATGALPWSATTGRASSAYRCCQVAGLQLTRDRQLPCAAQTAARIAKRSMYMYM
mmetsp:Transcript_24663/g.77310  ORF Transcript_24663/g.77310 Transcript_24663/m.77310 type:complete len:274 (-) Transcript_24663:11-832(-)